MAIVNINSILARYQYSFGYVAGSVANAAANRLWSILKEIPQYSDNVQHYGNSTEVILYETANSSFAEVILESSQSGELYRFGASTGTYGQDQLYLAPPLMLSFSRGKNVVKTAIDRSEIEVIEYFGLKPFSIKIQGILIDVDNHQYPSELVQQVNRMFEQPGTFKVSGTIFNDLGISEIFFEDGFEVDFVEGYVDTVKFSVNAISTTPLELISNGV